MARSQGKKKHMEVRERDRLSIDLGRDRIRRLDSYWKRQRKERVNQAPSNLPNVDVHGILFAVVAVVFVFVAGDGDLHPKVGSGKR